MVKQSGNRGYTSAPLASFESLMSLESGPEDKTINWKTWSEETPWTAPTWQKMSLRSQNCQVYRVSQARLIIWRDWRLND